MAEATNSEDAALLRRCRQGDAAAWECLLDKYERLVFSIARNSGLGSEDAAEITQLTFTYLIESLDRMSDEGNLKGWLATVARRHSRRLLVRQLRYRTDAVEPELIEALLPNRPNRDSVERWELAEWLRSGLDRLDQRCRRLLLALFFDPREPSYEEIAGQLDMAVGSVGPTRARCLARLKQLLEAD